MKNRFAIFIMLGVITLCTMTGCKKDDDLLLAPNGTIAPPSWLIGKWSSGILTDCEVRSDNLIINFMDFRSWTNLYFNREMKEIKKTNSEYIVGRISTSNSTVFPSYYFKRGNGRYIEMATYDSENNKWNNFKKYNKK